MSGFDDTTIDIIERLTECAALDEMEGATESVISMTREAAQIITSLRAQMAELQSTIERLRTGDTCARHMTQVVVFPRGQLSNDDKERMEKAGICAVEADDPSQVCTILPLSGLATGDHLMLALLKGINCSSYESASSVALKELHRLVKQPEGNKVQESGKEGGE